MTPENATHWRDLIEGLTPKQIRTLENAEQTGDYNDRLLDVARDCVAGNLTEAMLASVPAPPGAQTVTAWLYDGDGDYVRYCTFHRAEVVGGSVEVTVTQASCGHCGQAQIIVEGVEELNAAAARELAAALIAAADELDRLQS